MTDLELVTELVCLKGIVRYDLCEESFRILALEDEARHRELDLNSFEIFRNFIV